MAEDTFDGLKDALANSLFKEEKSLKEVIKLLKDSKPPLDPSIYSVILSEGLVASHNHFCAYVVGDEP